MNAETKCHVRRTLQIIDVEVCQIQLNKKYIIAFGKSWYLLKKRKKTGEFMLLHREPWVNNDDQGPRLASMVIS